MGILYNITSRGKTWVVTNVADESIPIDVRSDWVWANITQTNPEVRRENFDFDDPWMMEQIFKNQWGFKGFPGARVLDIGANKGVFTALCALNGAYVTAFEPNPIAFKILLDTITRNGIEKYVRPVQAAITTFNGSVWIEGTTVLEKEGQFARGKTVNSRTCSVGEKGTTLVTALSLADAIGNQDWDCVKCDIEGHEFELFLAVPENVLRQIKLLSLEIHSGWASDTLYESFVQRLRLFFYLDGIRDNQNSNRMCYFFGHRRATVTVDGVIKL